MTPGDREPPGTENLDHAIPVDTVESFMEIELEDQCRSVMTVAAVEEVGGIGKTISDAAPEDEAGLVIATKREIIGWSLVVRTLDRLLTVVF